MAHYCHARGCDVEVPRKLLMCRRHWFMVPKDLRDRVWATYQAGQEEGRARVTREYLDAAGAAVDAVAEAETKAAAKLAASCGSCGQPKPCLCAPSAPRRSA